MMLDYNVTSRRIDNHGSEAMAKAARLVLDTDMADHPRRRRSDRIYVIILRAKVSGLVLRANHFGSRMTACG